jgi:hypothetical protein
MASKLVRRISRFPEIGNIIILRMLTSDREGKSYIPVPRKQDVCEDAEPKKKYISEAAQ